MPPGTKYVHSTSAGNRTRKPPSAVSWGGGRFGLIGVTLRNTDDCGLPEPQSFLGDLEAFVQRIRTASDAFVVVGGIGFSIMPEEILRCSGTDVGVWGKGELAFPELARRWQGGEATASQGNSPVFVEPSIAGSITETVEALVGRGERFLFFGPSKPDCNYNYNANQRLVEAIRSGCRGAYWDILRRIG